MTFLIHLGNKDSMLGVEGLIDSWRNKKVSIINTPGCGIADDKAVYAYVPGYDQVLS